MRYRRDIDGLRAVAVLAVVFFHAKLPGFSGGFVGVDVFFVISGFLITGLMAHDRGADRFSLATFYFRRIRRIVPALLCVYIACTLAAAVLMLPSDMAEFGRSLAELGDVRLQPFFLRPGRLFRRGIRSEASAAHLVALDRGAVLPGLAAAVPGDRPLAVSMAAVFRVGCGGNLARRIGGHGCPPQGSRVLPRSLSGLGTPAGRSAGAHEQAAGDHGADGRALRRRRPVDDRRVCPLPG